MVLIFISSFFQTISMSDEQLLEDFIDFIRKQLHYGSSKAPMLEAMIGDYTGSQTDIKKITAGLHKLNAILYTNGNAVIDMKKIIA
jgi:hypothetical protein